jgi:bifunctional non-homologous end joining protein LigD
MVEKTIRSDGRTVTPTNIDKVLYPDDGIIKGDVLDYYQDVSGVMLPHLRGRPLVMRRFPDGIDGGGFFQKNASDYFPDWITTVSVPQRTGEGAVRHVVCDDAATLLYLANQACLEFHPWLSRTEALNCPDRLIIDVDPPGGVDLTDLRGVVGRLREVFERVDLVPFVQLTGGKGFHVVAALDGRDDYELVRGLARDIATQLAEDDPDLVTTEQRKARRGKRIFLDTARNAYGQTAIAPYSLRARPAAPVATPIEWSELGNVEPGSYHIGNIRRRLAHKSDPWADLDRHRRSARTARKRLDHLGAGS